MPADAAALDAQPSSMVIPGDPETAADLDLRALATGRDVDKHVAARLIRRCRKPLPPEHAEALCALLTDPAINPRSVERAGWRLLHAAGRIPQDAETAAGWLEQDRLAQALLRESHVTLIEAEFALTGLRRWLLLSGRFAEFPATVAALKCQAMQNGGAWLFDAEEEARLARHDGMRASYLPPRPAPVATPDYASPVTRLVAAQYDRWPYPAWKRAAAGRGESFSAIIAALGPDAPQAMPEDARVLIAGCGTGLQALTWAQRFPRLRITAIDISAGALAYAQARHGPEHVNLRFERCDLHRAAHLGSFDVIATAGVLHHLPDPEAGWAALTRLLAPGGVMRVGLYSALARIPVRAAQSRIADLANQPVHDTLLRQVRARLMAGPPGDVTRSPDFFHLGGVHDLLLHRHEDAFDVARIRGAMAALGLDLLRFRLPPAAEPRYRSAHPEDPGLRDFTAWAAFERRHPRTFAGMYDFWCQPRPSASMSSRVR